MRGRPALAAMLLAMAGGVGLVLAASPAGAEPKPSGSVTVNPQSGPPDTSIAVEYRQNNPLPAACKHALITFKWDGHAVTAGALNSNCVARASFKPPQNDRKPGPYQVTAWNGGSALGGTFFLIDKTNPSGSPSPSPSASPSKSKGTKSSPTPTTTAATDPVLPTYDGPTATGSVDAAGAAATGGPAGSSSSGGGMSPIGVALAFGGALVLGGVLILGFIIFRGRRGEPEPAFALGDSPTQPILTGFPRAFLPAPVDPYPADPPTLTDPPVPPPVPD